MCGWPHGSFQYPNVLEWSMLYNESSTFTESDVEPLHVIFEHLSRAVIAEYGETLDNARKTWNIKICRECNERLKKERTEGMELKSNHDDIFYAKRQIACSNDKRRTASISTTYAKLDCCYRRRHRGCNAPRKSYLQTILTPDYMTRW